MSYLVDTHTLIWAVCSPGKLSPEVRLLLKNPNENILVSPVSFWEISLKYSLGKLYLEGWHQRFLWKQLLKPVFRSSNWLLSLPLPTTY